MKQFLTSDVRDDVLTASRGLKMDKGETIQQYIEKFWDLHLKDFVFENIEFSTTRMSLMCALSPQNH